jgi:hypothetical protein
MERVLITYDSTALACGLFRSASLGRVDAIFVRRGVEIVRRLVDVADFAFPGGVYTIPLHRNGRRTPVVEIKCLHTGRGAGRPAVKTLLIRDVWFPTNQIATHLMGKAIDEGYKRAFLGANLSDEDVAAYRASMRMGHILARKIYNCAGSLRIAERMIDKVKQAGHKVASFRGEDVADYEVQQVLEIERFVGRAHRRAVG